MAPSVASVHTAQQVEDGTFPRRWGQELPQIPLFNLETNLVNGSEFTPACIVFFNYLLELMKAIAVTPLVGLRCTG